LVVFERTFIIFNLVAAGVSSELREWRYSTDISCRLSQALDLNWVCSKSSTGVVMEVFPIPGWGGPSRGFARVEAAAADVEASGCAGNGCCPVTAAAEEMEVLSSFGEAIGKKKKETKRLLGCSHSSSTSCPPAAAAHSHSHSH